MIGYLEGTIKTKFEKNIILLTAGVGYLVSIPNPTLDNIEINKKISLFIYTKVREDDISLYGFKTIEKLNFFKLLISVNGVGAKTALDIMSKDINQIKTAIIQEDHQTLSQTPGIGKKTAQRIILDLKSKITITDLDTTRQHTKINSKTKDEAKEALRSLGYQNTEIERTLKDTPENIQTTEEIITYFLKNI